MRPDELDDTIRTIAKRARREPLFARDASTRTLELGRGEIERMLPHRDPFLFVDRITSIDLAQAAIEGRRRIDSRDPIFRGHFPGAPIYPGVLQLETMGQLAICLSSFLARGSIEVDADTRPLDVRALKIHAATFLAPVSPGDTLTILARSLVDDGQTAVHAGQLYVNGQVAALAVMEMLHVDPT